MDRLIYLLTSIVFTTVFSCCKNNEKKTFVKYRESGLDSLYLFSQDDVCMHFNFFGLNQFSYFASNQNKIVYGVENSLETYKTIKLENRDYLNHLPIGLDSFLIISMKLDSIFVSFYEKGSLKKQNLIPMHYVDNLDTITLFPIYKHANLQFDKSSGVLYLPAHSYENWDSPEHFESKILFEYQVFKEKLNICDVGFPKSIREKSVGNCNYHFHALVEDKIVFSFFADEDLVEYDPRSNSRKEIAQNQTGYKVLDGFDFKFDGDWNYMFHYMKSNYLYHDIAYNKSSKSIFRRCVFPKNSTDSVKSSILIYDLEYNLKQEILLKGDEAYMGFVVKKDKVLLPILSKNKLNEKSYFSVYEIEN